MCVNCVRVCKTYYMRAAMYVVRSMFFFGKTEMEETKGRDGPSDINKA